MSIYARGGKRLFDLIVSALGLVVLSPIPAGVALAVALKLGAPVLFVQERSGWRGRPFRLIKFRSMLDRMDEQGRPLSDEERLTVFGTKLRSTSLDELPALWNVLKGDMSLVGPRPLHRRYDALYSPRQARRLEARPGVTGWAQVNGRNALGWPEKFALDAWYVDHRSFWLDIRIILQTVLTVFLRQGISAEGAATMPEFRGERGPGE